jgi:hypothetical protein
MHMGVLTKPMRAEDARALMDSGADRAKTTALSAEQLADALREAAARTADIEENVTFELWFALRALARALGVDFAILPDARLYL